MRVIPISSINKWRRLDEEKFVAFSELEYDCQITNVALSIEENPDKRRVVLLSGPSGSGKTVSSYRVREKLMAKGITTHILSMDNYFLADNDPRNERDEDGKIDFESPKRLDIELLSEHLTAMHDGKRISVPTFNFKLQKREESFDFTLGEGEVVIIEGIHALNPEVTGALIDQAIKVYVSVRTRMKAENGECLHPSKIRLMRRFVRDKLFRGRDLHQTLHFFEDVERGEQRYIMPFKGNANYDIDTFLPFEASVYKPLIIDDVREMARTEDSRFELDRLLMFLEELEEVEVETVPENSLSREFVGGNRLMHK